MSKRSSLSARKDSGKRRMTFDAVKILESLIGDDPKVQRMVEEATVDAIIGQIIYDARTKGGLTQAQLAKLVGTKQPVISQLEDADYEGHSLSMLRRIAEALGKRLEIRFVDVKRRRSA
jgi:ribosome-binding protein aMBF1 (putative translation factor)